MPRMSSRERALRERWPRWRFVVIKTGSACWVIAEHGLAGSVPLSMTTSCTAPSARHGIRHWVLASVAT